MPRTHNEVGGDSFHVRDCYVWAEIYYLDSDTDYREYLPSNAAAQPRLIGDDLIMLDSKESSLRALGCRIMGWLKYGFLSLAAVVFLAMLLSSC